MLLETITGDLLDLEDPKIETINIHSIAWGLSRLSRFCGMTITVVPYSVAQHSIFVAKEVQAYTGQVTSSLVLKALLHDAAEAYIGDIPSPVKKIAELHPVIKRIENRLMEVIYEAYDLAPPTESEQRIIKEADLIAQKIEAYNFMPSRGAHWPGLPEVSLKKLQSFDQPKPSIEVYEEFMDMFNTLRNH